MRYARISLVCFLALSLQVTVTAQVPVSGAIVDVVLIATIAAALAEGPEAGAGVGFGCGLVIDLLGVGPVGLTSLVYTLVGYAVGVSQTGVVRSSRLIPLAVAGAAAPLATYAYALTGEVLGQSIFEPGEVAVVAVVNTVGVLVACLPFRALMTWAFGDDGRSRIHGGDLW